MDQIIEKKKNQIKKDGKRSVRDAPQVTHKYIYVSQLFIFHNAKIVLVYYINS